MMFQGPIGYIAQICEVHLQYGNMYNKMAVLHFCRVNSTLIYILFSLLNTLIHGVSSKLQRPYLINSEQKLNQQGQFNYPQHFSQFFFSLNLTIQSHLPHQLSYFQILFDILKFNIVIFSLQYSGCKLFKGNRSIFFFCFSTYIFLGEDIYKH